MPSKTLTLTPARLPAFAVHRMSAFTLAMTQIATVFRHWLMRPKFAINCKSSKQELQTTFVACALFKLYPHHHHTTTQQTPSWRLAANGAGL